MNLTFDMISALDFVEKVEHVPTLLFSYLYIILVTYLFIYLLAYLFIHRDRCNIKISVRRNSHVAEQKVQFVALKFLLGHGLHV